MNKLLIGFVMFLNACGSNSGGDGGGPAQVESQPTISTSYYVATASQLVECNDKSRGFLAYVQDVQEFRACLAAGWSKVDVKGKDGSTGSTGATGATTMISGNQWYDTMLSKMWVMTNINTSTTGFTDAQSTCSGSYRIPTYTEAQTALGHGMAAMAMALSSPPTYIMTSGISSSGKGVRISDAVYMIPASGSAAQFCIAQ